LLPLAVGRLVLYSPKVCFLPPLQPPPPRGPTWEPTPTPTDPRTRITQFINAYDGGDCFFIEPRMVKDGDARLEGLGSSQGPFEALNSEFIREFGFEAEIGWGPVTPQQCPAVNFLARSRNEPRLAPRLEIDMAGLRRTPPELAGSVAEFGDRYVELLLIADDGLVTRMTEKLKQSGNAKTFSVKLGGKRN